MLMEHFNIRDYANFVSLSFRLCDDSCNLRIELQLLKGKTHFICMETVQNRNILREQLFTHNIFIFNKDKEEIQLNSVSIIKMRFFYS